MKIPPNPNIGQEPFDKNVRLVKKLDKLIEMVQRLQASQSALIATLKEIPAGDGEMMLNVQRWNSFQTHLEQELRSFGLK
jgi:hypothetical protein